MADDRTRTKTKTAGVYRRGETYCYQLRVPTGDGRTRQVWRSINPQTGQPFRTMGEAKAAREAERTDRTRGRFVDPTRLTVAEWLNEHWLPVVETKVIAGKLAPSSLDGSRLLVRAYLIPHLGHHRLQNLDGPKLDAFLGKLLREGARGGKPLAPKTVRNIASGLHSALEVAVKYKLLPLNPVKLTEIRLDPHRAERLRYWETEEAQTFLAHTAADRLQPLWTLLLGSGCRRGETLALRWSDVSGTGISVTKSLTAYAGKIREGQPKTRTGVRTITLDAHTLSVLDDWKARQSEERERVEAIEHDYNPDGYVFTDEAGRPLHPHTVSRTFDRAVASSGLPRIVLHDLRHTHATMLLKAKVPYEVVSKRLGHTDPGFTIRQYRHVTPSEQTEAASVVGDLLHGRHLRAV